MFFSICLKIFPEMISKGVLRITIRLKYILQLRMLVFQYWELEVSGLSESNNIDAFSVLRNYSSSINDLIIDMVAKVIQSLKDNTECLSMIMASKVLNIFKNEGFC